MPAQSVNSGRIKIPYVPDGIDHVFQMMVGTITGTGPGFQIPKRTGVGGTGDWRDAASDLAAALSNVLPTGTIVGAAILEKFDGLAYLPIGTLTVTLPSLNGGAFGATGATASFHDENFHIVKPIVFDVNVAAPFRFLTPTGGNANFDALLLEFTENFTLTDAPYLYMQSSWGDYLREGGFIACTNDLNDLQRKRWGFV